MSKKLIKTEYAPIYLGAFLRLIYFIINLFIGGRNIDEAMLSLNAASLSNSGTDISGMKMPVYFDTWVHGGQSPLPTYLSAITVKAFGFNLFGIRLPALLMSIAGLVFFCFLIKELKFKDTESFAIQWLACICPWGLFSSVYVLDCNYFGHFCIIALFILAKATNTGRLRYYALSMVFFALSMYCYLASVLIIPILLSVFYLTLILKKKINISQILTSVIVIFIIALPFIAFGLINTGVIKPFELFGFTFQKMEGYVRYRETIFRNDLNETLLNAVRSFALTFFIDFCMVDITALFNGENIFLYGNALGGIFLLCGILVFAKALLKKSCKSRFSFTQKVFALSVFAGTISFITLVENNNYSDIVYRYGVLSYFLIPFEGIGLYTLAKRLKNTDIKKVIAVYLIVSLAVFNFEFFDKYAVQTKEINNVTYGDSLYKCFKQLDECPAESVTVYQKDNTYFTRISVFCRCYYYDRYDFINIREEIAETLEDKNKAVSCTDNGKILFETDNGNLEKYKYLIISDDDHSVIDSKNYTIYDCGYFNLYEKSDK